MVYYHWKYEQRTRSIAGIICEGGKIIALKMFLMTVRILAFVLRNQE